MLIVDAKWMGLPTGYRGVPLKGGILMEKLLKVIEIICIKIIDRFKSILFKYFD